MTHIYKWEEVYKAAKEETDPAKVRERVLVAEEVILNRVTELSKVATRHSINELAWLEKAIEGLAKLQSEKLPSSAASRDISFLRPDADQKLARKRASGA